MNIEEILKNITDVVVPTTIGLDEVLKIPNYHATLKVQIWNNQIYTDKTITEERNIQVLNQLRDTLKEHLLPNTTFAYCTQDHTPDEDCFLFTHAVQLNTNKKNIPAPCFTFDEYTAVYSKEPMHYDNVRQSLYEVSKPFMESIDTWNQKKDAIIFVGTLNNDNDRLANTNFGNIPNVEQIIINNGNYINDKYITREDLANYKYLLHLNGHNGAYASRLKYLLMTGSLCFYVMNYKGKFKPWLEYWMFYKDLLDCVIMSKTAVDCKNATILLNRKRELAFEKAKKGFEIVHSLLEKKNVLLYWKVLLEKYTANFDRELTEQIYFVPYL
jgi:hypothetical protein